MWICYTPFLVQLQFSLNRKKWRFHSWFSYYEINYFILLKVYHTQFLIFVFRTQDTSSMLPFSILRRTSIYFFSSSLIFWQGIIWMINKTIFVIYYWFAWIPSPSRKHPNPSSCNFFFHFPSCNLLQLWRNFLFSILHVMFEWKSLWSDLEWQCFNEWLFVNFYRHLPLS